MSKNRLKRVVGTPGAVFLGLGSIVGTGVFVSLGIGAGIAGPSVILALSIAAVLALFNGLSSAQLAASHPVSGGTYEYAYTYLSPSLGFAAGWMFLFAKSASAATAALGLAGYLFKLLGISAEQWNPIVIGMSTVGVMTFVILGGMRRTTKVNALIVSLTLFTLAVYVFVGFGNVSFHSRYFTPFFDERAPVSALLGGSALMFVAFTGYGRIATLGEEVREPRTTIPRAVLAALGTSWLLYTLVAIVSIASVGSAQFSLFTIVGHASPLQAIAEKLGHPKVASLVAVGALCAMLGVLLNLILGLSRVALAMGRRGDLPKSLGSINEKSGNPTAAILFCSGVIMLLTLLGNVKTTWSFSALTVLVYYAITNLAALRIPIENRLYPRWTAIAGLVGCAGLTFYLEPRIWIYGVGSLLLGFGIRWVSMLYRAHASE